MRNPFDYKGRLNRQPYFLIGIIIGAVIQLLVRYPKAHHLAMAPAIQIIIVVILLLSGTGVIMLTIARLHDLDKSGWYVLLQVVPLINFIFALYVLFAKGTTGPNRFGPDPLNSVGDGATEAHI